jgi:sugar O-acyltransferase (sialic acid O-acetyltransferase NeuD family)
MKEIIIIGAGGHAAEIDEYIRNTHFKSEEESLKVVGFIDDNPLSYGAYQFSAPFLGGIQGHEIDTTKYYIIGIANVVFRKPIVELFLEEGAQFVTFIHSAAYVSLSARIGLGVVIAPFVNIGPNVQIDDFTLINARASIGHDTVVGKHNFITPNVCLSGFTKIGNENIFGINSATIPGINVGNRNKIAAGMVLDKNIEDDSVVFHRFKEKVIAVPQ